MEHSAAYSYAQEYLAIYREILLVDPLYRLNILLVDEGPACICQKDNVGKCSWTAHLNINLHIEKDDIRLSILEFLSDIMLVELDFNDDAATKAAVEKVKCRLFNVFQALVPDLDAGDGNEV